MLINNEKNTNNIIKNFSDIIAKTEKFVKNALAGESTGHDWWHINRVRNLALLIAKEEKNNKFINFEIVELAALLHDIADYKFHNGDITVGPRVAREWLESINISENDIDHICSIIKNLSYKGAGSANNINTIEGKIVQDADRLDALGAIGIARCFAYGGWKGNAMYDPEHLPVLHQTFEQYKSAKTTSVNHFYEKLLLIKDRLNTDAAKTIAAERHEFMEEFLNQFYKEWNLK